MTTERGGDYGEISQVVQRYFAALDEKDYDRLDQVFTADAVLRYSLDESTGQPLSVSAMIARIRDFNTVFRFTQHLAGLPSIDIEGDTAEARTSLQALHVQQHHNGSASHWFVRGVYWDSLVRTSAGWRIRGRIFRAISTEGTLLPAGDVITFERPPWR